jgi:hypothetical protein
MSIASNISNSSIFNSFMPTTKSPSLIAQGILADTQIGKTAHNIEKIAAGLGQFAQNDPLKAAYVKTEVMNALSPTEQGELSSVLEKIESKSGLVDKSYISSPKDVGIMIADSYFNLKDYYTVSAHGGPDNIVGVPNSKRELSAKAQAQLLYNDIIADGWNRKKPIILLMCRVGKGQIPAELARIAKVPVYAATGYTQASTWLEHRQDVVTKQGAANGGKFLQFNPNGTQQNPFNIKNEYSVVGLVTRNDGRLKLVTVPNALVDAAVKKQDAIIAAEDAIKKAKMQK